MLGAQAHMSVSHWLWPLWCEACCAHGTADIGGPWHWDMRKQHCLVRPRTCVCGCDPDLAPLRNQSQQHGVRAILHQPERVQGRDSEDLQPWSTKVRLPSHLQDTVLPTLSPGAVRGHQGPAHSQEEIIHMKVLRTLKAFSGKGGEHSGVSTDRPPLASAPRFLPHCSGV